MILYPTYADSINHTFGQLLAVINVAIVAILTWSDEFFHYRHTSRGNHGVIETHGLKQYVGETFHPRGKDEYIAVPHVGIRIVLETQESDTVICFQGGFQLPPVIGRIPANDGEHSIRYYLLDLLESIHQNIHALGIG